MALTILRFSNPILSKSCISGNRRLGIEPQSRHQARRTRDPATVAINSTLEEPDESDVEMEDVYASPTPQSLEERIAELEKEIARLQQRLAD